MHINISIDTDCLSAQDRSILSFLGASTPTQLPQEPPQPQVGENSGTSASASPPTEGAGVSEGAVGQSAGSDAPSALEKKKRPGRPTKEEVAAREAAKQQEAQAGDQAQSNGTRAESGPLEDCHGAVAGGAAADAKPLTGDDVLAALQAFTAKHTVEAGVKLLAEFGATRRSELKPDQYAAFVAKCNEGVAA